MIKVTIGNNISRKALIVSETMTLKEACNQAEFDYTRTSMNLDGTTLAPGDINKTFADFGVTDTCYLLGVAKADNAVKVTVAGDAMVVTSAIKFDDLKTVEKYRPEALTLKGGKDGKEDIFKVGTTKGAGSINTYGVSFKESRGDGHFAQITVMLPSVDDVKEYISDKYGVAIINLGAIEESLPSVVAGINEEKARIQSFISFE